MLIAAFCLPALVVAVALLEWMLWRKRRRSRAEIDAFMEWHTYPEPGAAPGGETRGRGQTHGTGSRAARPAEMPAARGVSGLCERA